MARRRRASATGRSAPDHDARGGRGDWRDCVQRPRRRRVRRPVPPPGRGGRGARGAALHGEAVGISRRLDPPGRHRPGRDRPDRRTRRNDAATACPRPAGHRSAAGAQHRGGGAPPHRPGRVRAAARAQRYRRARVRRVRGRRSGPTAAPLSARRRRIHPDAADACDGGHRTDQRAARDRRAARRFRLGDRHPHHGLHPDRAHRGSAGHRGDRGVDGVRQRPPLLRLLRPLHPARGDAHQSGRPRGDPRRRPHVGAVRPVPRPAARVPVRGERLRRAGRLARERRRQHRVLAVERQFVGHAGQRRIETGRQRHEQLGTVRHPRRPVVERALRHGRPDRCRRLDRRDADPVQEPALSVARRRTGPPLGLPDHPHHPRQVGGAVVVADLAGRGRPAHAVRGAGRPVGSVPEPQPGIPSGADRLPARIAGHRDRRVRRRRSRRRAGVRGQVRPHPQPDRRLHPVSRLLPDRIGPAADRDQSALPALLPGAASVLSGGTGDLSDGDAADPGSTPARSPNPTSAGS